MPLSRPAPMDAVRAAAGAALMLIPLLLAVACSAAPSPLPDGVSVRVEQNRSEVTDRRIGIVVNNQSGETLTVTGAVLESDSFDGDATWQKERTQITAGRTVHLPVQLADADCGAGAADNLVRLRVSVGDQPPIDVAVEPTDEFDRLRSLHAEDCFESDIAQVAGLNVAAARVERIGATSALQIDIAIEPTGVDASFTIDDARGTTLFAPADPSTGSIVARAPVDQPVEGTEGAAILTLTFVPNRCDAHAVAEDKLGTVLPLAVTNDHGQSGVVMIAAPTAAKSAMLDYLTAACASR